MSAILWPVTARIAALLDSRNGTSEHETAMRLLKVTEEAGEAAAAYIGTTGQNPRKGTTHTRTDVADELCDVIIAAAVALHSFTDHAPAALNDKLNTAVRRLTGANTLSPDIAYADAPDIRIELDWLNDSYDGWEPSADRDPHEVRQWRLRNAAVLDRIALIDQSDDPGHDDAAEMAAVALVLHDDVYDTGPHENAADCTPRGYVRQQYQNWHEQYRADHTNA